MKSSVAVTIAFLLAAGTARTQETLTITPEMTSTETRLLTKVSPEGRAWIKQEAARQRSGISQTGTIDQQTWKTFPSLGPMGDGDIMAIAFLVMMEASKSADEDLKSVMAGVKAINKQKAAIRETQRASTTAGDAQSAKMQTSMDRRAKMLETASNLMKKMAETGSTTVRNLK